MNRTVLRRMSNILVLIELSLLLSGCGRPGKDLNSTPRTDRSSVPGSLAGADPGSSDRLVEGDLLASLALPGAPSGVPGIGFDGNSPGLGTPEWSQKFDEGGIQGGPVPRPGAARQVYRAFQRALEIRSSNRNPYELDRDLASLRAHLVELISQDPASIMDELSKNGDSYQIFRMIFFGATRVHDGQVALVAEDSAIDEIEGRFKNLMHNVRNDPYTLARLSLALEQGIRQERLARGNASTIDIDEKTGDLIELMRLHETKLQEDPDLREQWEWTRRQAWTDRYGQIDRAQNPRMQREVPAGVTYK